jgi:hypothetical protein
MNFKALDVDGKMMRTGQLALVVAFAAMAASAVSFPARAGADSILPVQPMAAAMGPANGMVELDTTGGGTIDYRVYYDGRGKVAREEIASKHDGRMDTFYYYKDGILQKVEIDSKGTGRIDLWVYLLDGKYVQRYERDTTGSGKPDVVRVFGQN